MSEFEELFQSIQNSVTVDVVRDSAIVLVNEGDAEHPLKAGEYYFDEEKNILYVGGYVPDKFYIWKFIKHETSTRYIPAPRAQSNLRTSIPRNIIHYSNVVYAPANRTTSELFIEISKVNHNSNIRLTNMIKTNLSLTTIIPTISHTSSVN